MPRNLAIASSLVILLTTFQTQAQTPGMEWARTFKNVASPNIILPIDIVTDGSGNVYTTGIFYNTRDFDPGPGTFNLTSAGNKDIFVSKLTSAGGFVWAVRIGAATSDSPAGIAVDDSGNVYITGGFSGTLDFDPGPGVSTLTGPGSFVCKLNASGGFVWARLAGASGATGISVGTFGDVVITGTFSGSGDFDPGAGVVTLTSLGPTDIFVSKLNSTGDLVWAQQMGGTLGDGATAVTTDISGNIYTIGSFVGTADFDPGTGTSNLISGGLDDIFISKLSSTGVFGWVKRIGGTGYESPASIALDGSGNVLTTGSFATMVDFDPGGSVYNLTSSGPSDIFISKLDPAGNFTWAKSIGGGSSSLDIATDASDNVYSTGHFDTIVDFDPGAGVNNVTPFMSPEAFVTKLDAGGNFQWVVTPRGTVPGWESQGETLSVDLSGNIVAAGWFESLVDFDPGVCDEILTAASDDIYIWKLSPSIPLSTNCAPAITGFFPASGPIGSSVKINGTNFNLTEANNIVYFGATRATVTASSKTQLTATVPAGATFQPISVTVNGLTGFSGKPFLVTFPDGGTIDACSFTSPLGFGPDSGGFGVAIGDLDGDGKTDVAVTDYFANSIRIFRNTSTPGTLDAGTFAPSVNFGVGINPYEVSIADIDGDGKLDIIASNWNGSTISIFRNTSTVGSLTAASFAARLDLATGTAPFNISCQDLDGDGKTDIAVGNAGGGAISIWQNIGSPGSITAGSFNPRLDIPGPSSGFTIADVDVDGKPDLVGGYNGGSAIGVSRNISSPGTLTTGSFAAFVNFTVAAWPEQVVVGDLDADNRPDIVTMSWPSNKISILKNTSTPGSIGAGSFATNLDIDGNGEPRDVSITDFDGDGLPDIGLSNQTGSISIYKNANTPGTITSASFLPKVNYSPTGNGRDLTSGDIDGDGKPDLVVAAWSSPSLVVLRNTVSSLPTPTITNVSPAAGPVGTTVIITGTNFSGAALLNNTVKFNDVTAPVLDATPTTITTEVPAGATTGTISVSVGCNTATSSGSFIVSPPGIPVITNFSPADGPIGTTVTITGNNFSATPANNIVFFGATKATVTSGTTTQLTVTVPTGATYMPISVLVNGLTAYSSSPFDITFPDGGTIDACSFAPKVDFTTGTGPKGIVIADLDGDGKADLALVNQNSNTLSVYLNTSTTGDITASSFAAKVDFTTAAFPSDMAVGDMDGDGKLDLVAINAAPSNSVSVFRNTSTPGTISFSARSDFGPLGPNSSRIAIGDLDGDGKLDIAVPNNFTKVSVFMNLSKVGSVAFGAKFDFTVYSVSNSPNVPAIADLDGDGKQDLVVSLGDRVSLLRNTATPGVIDVNSFAPYVDFVTGTGPIDLDIGDLDGDLKPDIVTAHGTTGLISVLRNTSTPGSLDATSFSPKVDFASGAFPNKVAIDDLDGDGKPELAIARNQIQPITLSILKNTATPGTINTGSFATLVGYSIGTGLSATYFIASGDLDGDGAPELVITNNKISILRNTVAAPTPTISSFTPMLGPIGTTVTITGTNFSTIPSRNAVRFNGIPAIVTASTATEIITTVPFNATPGTITVTVGCNPLNTVTSTDTFTVNGDCVTSTERNALEQLYYATNGASWNHNDNWLSADESTWYGVTVTGCFVTSISLGENNLNGFLPAQIGNLTHLTQLHLKENLLSGNIPAVLGNLTNLAILNLGTNEFSSMSDFSSSLLDKNNLDFNVNHNRLNFGSLEPNMVFDLLDYAPQELVYPGDIIPFVPGQTLTIPFSALGTANSYQWFKDGVAIGAPGTTDDYTKASANTGDAGQYHVEITNSIVTGLTLSSDLFTVMTDPCAGQPRLSGNLDLTFDPDIGSPAPVTAVGVQSTGQIIASVSPAGGIQRFNPDGTLDGSFSSNTRYTIPGQMIVQADDKILVSLQSGNLERLNEDGSDDTAFNGRSADQIFSIGLQPDGKILMSYFAESPPYLIRLFDDGNDDPSFSAPEDLPANTIEVQPDGFILLGGDFPGGIVRLDQTGAIDPMWQGYLSGVVLDIAIQADGKIIAVGTFTDLPSRGLVRFNTDGTIDNTFNALGITGLGLPGNFPSKVLINADGKILISGLFEAVNGSFRENLVRLNSDGTVDCSFDPAGGTDTTIEDMILDGNGKILIAGSFTSYDGTTRNGLARVTNTAGASCLPTSERAALVALFNATNGAGWTVKTNWLTPDESTWSGVTVSACHVTSIVLSSNNLVGPLPVEIGNLPSLIELDLSTNHINGTLPASITSLTNLEVLYVDNNNGITGPLPANIGNMTALKFIDTQANAFTGPIPPSMSNCLALQNIHLEGNQHTGTLPPYFSTFPNLTSINLGFNLFSGSIPTSWGSIPNLNFLSLASNNLTGSIPIELGSLDNLVLMDLSRNQLSGSIPAELGNMGLLEFLELWTNQLTGSIPSQLGNATTLKFLRVSDNLLAGSIPTSLGSLPDLFLLDLNDNQLTGTIPSELGNNTQMKFLILSTNQLSGPIPPELGNLLLLEDLIFYDNQLTGTLPVQLGQCINLKRFGAGDNQLTGTLPKEYGSWTNLTDFGIYNNNITGAVPTEYLAWTQPIFLYFSGNMLDAIPTFTASTITEFNVFDNLFEFGDLEPNISVPGYNYSPQADLPGGTITINAGIPLTIPFVTSGTANQYQWFKNGVLVPGATSATFSIASAVVSDGGNYTVAITNTIVTGLTLNSLNFVVTIIPVLNITLQPSDAIVCEGSVATFNAGATGTTNILYQWQYSPDGIAPFVDIINGGGYSNVATTTLSVNSTGPFGAGRYRCKINGDLAATVYTNDEGLFINIVPSAPATTPAGSCTATSVILTASGGINGQYRWYTLASGGSAIAGEVNATYSTPVLSTQTNYFVSINNGTCESPRTVVTANINIVAKPVPATSNCTTTAATLTGPSGFTTYAWSDGSSTQQINVTLAGSYTLIVTAADGCVSPASDPVIFTAAFCNQSPAIAPATITATVDGTATLDLSAILSDPDNNLNLSTLKVISQPASGAIASIGPNGFLLLEYKGTSFAGKDAVTIEVCDLSGVCTQQTLSIDVVGEVIVYSGISPDGNGQNDKWIIQYIEALPDTKDNHVSVFNRWGDPVFEASNYDNVNRVFTGQNKNGNDLPTGTYFYKIEFSSGKKTMTGYLSLKR